MAQTFIERYNLEKTWHGKVLVMEIFHLAMRSHYNNWTVGYTASHFNVSIGLASENLRLAQAIHDNDRILKAPTRQRAIQIMNRRRI